MEENEWMYRCNAYGSVSVKLYRKKPTQIFAEKNLIVFIIKHDFDAHSVFGVNSM